MNAARNGATNGATNGTTNAAINGATNAATNGATNGATNAARAAPLRRLGLGIALPVLMTLAACRGGGSGEPPPPSPRGDAVRGAELMEKFECNRCHDSVAMEGVPRNKHCVHCHEDIVSGLFSAPVDVLAEWKPRVRPLAFAPRLASSPKHYRRAWVERFLLEPYDLRPHLTPMMPRLAISPSEARDIATAIAPEDEGPDPLQGADPDRGRELLDKKGCGTCHVFTGVPPLADVPAAAAKGDTPPPAIALAPDLRSTRDRLRPDRLLLWLRAPRSVNPNTLMPSLGLTDDDARDVAAYLMTAPLAPVAPAEPAPARLALLDRPVSYEEVSQRVLRKTCWHCHAEPDYGIGDGGPGNTGGFGFAPRGLSLADYDGVASGYLDALGERHSVFAPMPDGTPRLVSALVARQEEIAGRTVPGIRGMPLGLPALPPEEIQLVETWIAQGRPQ